MLEAGFERRLCSKKERDEGLTERDKKLATAKPQPQPTMTVEEIAKLSEKISAIQADLGDISEKIKAAKPLK